MSDPTAATFTVAPAAPTMSVSVSSTPAVFVVVPAQPEPEVGGGTVHGGSVGMSLSLSLSL